MKRKDVSNKYKIDLEKIYKDNNEFEKDIKNVKEKLKNFEKYKSNFTKSANTLYQALEDYFDIYAIIEKREPCVLQ